MKHSSFFRDLVLFVEKNCSTSVEVDSFSSVPFVLSLFKNRRVFLSVDSVFFDEFYSFFPQEKDVLGLPYISKKPTSYFYSFHQNLFQRSVDRLSSDAFSSGVCVFDSKNLNASLFPRRTGATLGSADKHFNYEAVIAYLKKNKYRRVDFLSSEGEYVLRGFIVDVFSYGEKKPFRLNFFDETPSFYSIGLSDGGIKKLLVSVVLFPKSPSGSQSLKDLAGAGSLFVEHKQGELFFINSLAKKNKHLKYKKGFFSFDYSVFSEVKKSKELYTSSWLTSFGFVYGGFVFSPHWFLESRGSFKKNLTSPALLLIEGDYYIHSNYGVCCFLGYEEDFSVQDRLCFSFADGILKVDVKYLFLVSYYSAKSKGGKPLDFLNKTKKWENKKKRALSTAENYVKNIVNSYISRGSSVKVPCDYDEDVFSLFMSGFKYKDTNDQGRSWSEILSDLCSTKPMDRLLCGDVGFGKTEVAIRAAFVSLCSNKSVAVVAPTTILTQQLYKCFKERLSPFGFSCFSVSRLSKKSSANVNCFLNEEASVIVGTHSIVRNDFILKKVGLFIVDEEHRFGVKDKERVFSLNSSVDYLSMSATPIPRSLQFSLSNVRDISTMLTPPVSRKPVIINILKYSYLFLKNIISSELSRGGQVFIVDNSVDNVVFLFNKLKNDFSGLSVSCLFGSQNKAVIAQTMGDFRSGLFDVLVSTTIIESGIDVPRANSLVVLNAHLFGLSQLYQLKGRVGRSFTQGYAFLFVPKKNKITSNGLRRLSSLQRHSSLGSGYDIALSDLDIRGPGALFGFSQSGASLVGFDFYTKLLNGAVSKLFPERGAILPENLPVVDLGAGFVSKEYIPFDRERVSVYSFVSACVSLDQLDLFYKDCLLKYGPPPSSFINLFKEKEFSLFLYNKGVSLVSFSQGLVVFVFSSLAFVGFDSMTVLLDSFFVPKKIPYYFKNNKGSFKFQFNYNDKDVYILVENLIKVLYV